MLSWDIPKGEKKGSSLGKVKVLATEEEKT